MIPGDFEYHAPSDVDEAVALLERLGDDAKVLAGGHSLVPAMRFRLAQPQHLVDINRIDGLAYIREGVGGYPLLLVHGYPETKRIWWRNIAPLAAAGFEVIVPDLRGHGDSDLAADGFYDVAAFSMSTTFSATRPAWPWAATSAARSSTTSACATRAS